MCIVGQVRRSPAGIIYECLNSVWALFWATSNHLSSRTGRLRGLSLPVCRLSVHLISPVFICRVQQHCYHWPCMPCHQLIRFHAVRALATGSPLYIIRITWKVGIIIALRKELDLWEEFSTFDIYHKTTLIGPRNWEEALSLTFHIWWRWRQCKQWWPELPSNIKDHTAASPDGWSSLCIACIDGRSVRLSIRRNRSMNGDWQLYQTG